MVIAVVCTIANDVPSAREIVDLDAVQTLCSKASDVVWGLEVCFGPNRFLGCLKAGQ